MMATLPGANVRTETIADFDELPPVTTAALVFTLASLPMNPFVSDTPPPSATTRRLERPSCPTYYLFAVGFRADVQFDVVDQSGIGNDESVRGTKKPDIHVTAVLPRRAAAGHCRGVGGRLICESDVTILVHDFAAVGHDQLARKCAVT